jgi:predicted nucleotide-binding protein
MADAMFFRIELTPFFQEFRRRRRRVFIVHGHDNVAKETVERFLEKLELVPVILHAQPNAGQTIIGKLERESKVPFAIILLTPDDLGHAKDYSHQIKPRARQNIIFELGFFIGKLGRKRVSTLYKKGVEIPSDLNGFAYISMDESDEWKRFLARELKHAGLKINLDRAFL